MTPIETYIFATLFIFALFCILFLLIVFINLDKKVDKLERKILNLQQEVYILKHGEELQMMAWVEGIKKRQQEKENKQ